MPSFYGFYSETIEFLADLTFNNNREWFYKHKDDYEKHVKEPITALASSVYSRMNDFKPGFKGEPRISRINKDTRFCKDKSPYKNTAWFYFNNDNIKCNVSKPTYFFKIKPDGYCYGFAYCPQVASELMKMRFKMDENVKKVEVFMKSVQKQGDLIVHGEKYKKSVCGENPEKILDWYTRKQLVFIKNCEHDDLFFSENLLDEVYHKFKELYPIYKFFTEI